jgi:hypothetical protein
MHTRLRFRLNSASSVIVYRSLHGQPRETGSLPARLLLDFPFKLSLTSRPSSDTFPLSEGVGDLPPSEEFLCRKISEPKFKKGSEVCRLWLRVGGPGCASPSARANAQTTA